MRRSVLRIPAASGAQAPLYRQQRDALLIYFFGFTEDITGYIRACIATDVAEEVWRPELRDPVEVWMEIQYQRRLSEYRARHKRRWRERKTAHLTKVLFADAPTLVDEHRTVKLELVEV